MELKILLLILRELTLENVAGGGFGRQVGYLLFSPGIKDKIMASGHITSWQIDGENNGNSDRFYLLGLQNH